MNPQTEILRTRDGHNISLRIFQQPGAPSGRVLVIGPGAGLAQDFYAPLAEYSAERGLTVVTFDYRGIGQSGNGPLKGNPATLRQWANHDLDAVLRHVHNRFPRQEVVFLGHCISGEMAGIAPASEYIHRLVLVSCALSCWRLWPLRSQFRILLIKLFAPILSALYGYFPGTKFGFLNDMPAGVAQELSGWCNHPNGLFDEFPDHNYRKLCIPMLAYSFSDDWFAPSRAVAALLAHFGAASTRWLHLDPKEIGLPGIGHDGFFDPRCRVLWDQLLNWIQAPNTSVP